MDDVAFEIDTSIYSVSSIRKAAHKFLGLYFVRMDRSESGSFRVSFMEKGGVTSIAKLKEAFFNEIFEYDIRERVAKETEPYTNLIMAHAFSKVPVIVAPGELDYFEDDPESIAKDPP